MAAHTPLYPPTPPSDLDWPAGCPVDPRRVVVLRGGSPRPRGRYVLYWCQVQKRAEWHPGLDYAAAQADALGLPLVVYEGLRPDYPHASWRHHRFILDGVRELAGRLLARGLVHYFYLGRAGGPRPKLVRELGAQAALVVTDDYPAFVVPGHNAAAAASLDCPLHAVDASGLAPLRGFPPCVAAFSLRPKLRALLPELLAQPDAYVVPRRGSLDLKLVLPPGLVRGDTLPDDPDELDRLVAGAGLDTSASAVRPAPGVRGGRRAGLGRLQTFLRCHLGGYADGRNRADVDVTSNLSPYLHYGMLSPGEIARAVRDARPAQGTGASGGDGAGDGNVEAFLEELLVRRELALNFCHHTPEPNRLDALPAWARENLVRHAPDPRRTTYDLPTLERAATHDPLWNTIQTELRELGEPHGYLRMLWGKKIIEWAPTYRDALEWMTLLNDRYAYDGRDAVSYTNFLWCFGLHDRPFPRRPVFGVMRPMSSESTGRKAHGGGYITRIRRAVRATSPSADGQGGLFRLEPA